MKRRLDPTDSQALIYLLALVLGCLLPFEFHQKHYFWERLADGSHLVLFGLLTAILFRCLRARGTSAAKACALSFLFTLLLGAAIEVIQPYFEREESLVDFANGLMGSALAAIFCYTQRRTAAFYLLWGLALCACSAAVFEPAYAEWQALEKQRGSFPMLADFEADWQHVLWHPINDRGEQIVFAAAEEPAHKSAGTLSGAGSLGRALVVTPLSGRYSGAEYRANNSNWSEYRELHFYARSELPETLLNLRIDDDGNCKEYDSRYNGNFAVSNDWKEFTVPLETIRTAPAHRVLNLGSIKTLLFFVKQPQPAPFYIDQLELRR